MNIDIIITFYCLSWAGDESEKEHIIHYLKELRDVIRNFITSLRLYSGKIIDFAFTSFKIMNYVLVFLAQQDPPRKYTTLTVLFWQKFSIIKENGGKNEKSFGDV